MSNPVRSVMIRLFEISNALKEVANDLPDTNKGNQLILNNISNNVIPDMINKLDKLLDDNSESKSINKDLISRLIDLIDLSSGRRDGGYIADQYVKLRNEIQQSLK